MNNQIVDFLESIYILNKLPEFYEASRSDYTKQLNYNNLGDNFPEIKDTITTVKDLPSYINLETKTLPENIKKINIEHYKGYAINFNGIDNVQSYLKSRFGNSSRYKLRRSIKKLENAFDISYKMYHGNITQEEYDLIFDEFFKLLEIRSIEKGIFNNRNISKKDFYYDKVLPLILQKKASLFVIYNGKKPIDICLNFHADKVIFQLIRTYDINYSKFNTGYIDLIKQIEWCLENQINIITFGYGSYYWKKRWCNFIYDYDYHIFYNKKSVKSRISAIKQTTNLRLRHHLRERGMIDKIHEIKDAVLGKLKPSKALKTTITNMDFNIKLNVGDKLNLYDSKYDYLRKHAFDFLFNFNEKESDISLYEIKNNSAEFLIKGLKNKVLINTQ